MPAEPAPLTRRERRQREEQTRRAARARRLVRGASLEQGSSRRRTSALAMVSVLGIALATSLPAMALVSAEEVHSRTAQAHFASGTATKDEVQGLDSVEMADSAPVVREDGSVTSAEQASALRTMRLADTFTNDPHGSIQWPFPVGVPITSTFGPRVAPTEGASTNHLGVDFAPGAGVPVQIIADGVVREVVARDTGGCGVNVTVDHMIGGRLVTSKYCHLQAGSVRVTAGERVKVAQIVGLVGSTGVSTGAHLHFEIRLDGTEPVDPFAWLEANAN